MCSREPQVENEMKQSQRWVTMAEVAEEACVSTITVSRVIRTPEKVAGATRARVQEVIARLGYVPNEGAGALSSRQNRTVGALIPTLIGSAFTSTIDGLSARLRAAGHQLLFACTDYSKDKEEDFIATMLRRRPTGLVLTSTAHTREAETLLRNCRIPVVEVWELPEATAHHAVGFSNRDGGFAMVRYLYELSYRRVGFIGRPKTSVRSFQRFAGYKEASREYGDGVIRRAVEKNFGPNNVERGAREFAALMAHWPDTDAVFCANDTLALGALSEAQRMGLTVPDDVAIAGFGDFEFADEFGVGLTTVRVPGFRIGELAAQLILNHEKDASQGIQKIDVGYEIVRRRTA